MPGGCCTQTGCGSPVPRPPQPCSTRPSHRGPRAVTLRAARTAGQPLALHSASHFNGLSHPRRQTPRLRSQGGQNTGVNVALGSAAGCLLANPGQTAWGLQRGVLWVKPIRAELGRELGREPGRGPRTALRGWPRVTPGKRLCCWQGASGSPAFPAIPWPRRASGFALLGAHAPSGLLSGAHSGWRAPRAAPQVPESELGGRAALVCGARDPAGSRRGVRQRQGQRPPGPVCLLPRPLSRWQERAPRFPKTRASPPFPGWILTAGPAVPSAAISHPHSLARASQQSHWGWCGQGNRPEF